MRRSGTGAYVRGELFRRMAERYVKHGASILDYGCGPGRISASLAGIGYDVTGVDQSIGMIGCAKRIPAGKSRMKFYVIGELAGLFEPDRWDAIVCSSVIEYIEEPLDTLRSFFRSLRPGGVLMLSYANLCTFWRLLTLSQRKRHPHLHFQYNVWTRSQALGILREAGFEMVTGPRFFESPFDKYPGFRFLSGSGYIGTLGLVVLRRPN